MPGRNPGWRVALAGFGIHLALGVPSAWSVFGKGIPRDWGWTEADKSWPFALCCLVCGLVTVPAGRIQDRIGPGRAATIGGALVGLGLLLVAFTTSPFGYVAGFGVLAGTGIGFGFAAVTPASLRWFRSARTGLIAGLVASGFGLAGAWIAPLVHGVAPAALVLGIAIPVVVAPLARLLRAPAANHIPRGEKPQVILAAETEFFRPDEMLSTWQFYALWFMYACGAGAGLMVIAKLATIAFVQAGIENGFLPVVALAVGHGVGSIFAGMRSDRVGRKWTFLGISVCQALMIALVSAVEEGDLLAHPVALAAIAAAIGANYGANLSLFPAIARDFYGARHFGMNYGLLFTAWGVGGFLLSLLAGESFDSTGSFRLAYFCAIGLLVAAAVVTLFVRPPRKLDLEPPELIPDTPLAVGS